LRHFQTTYGGAEGIIPGTIRQGGALYHGTLSLFLDGIIKNGLGGMNPISEWKNLDLAREIHPMVEALP